MPNETISYDNREELLKIILTANVETGTDDLLQKIKASDDKQLVAYFSDIRLDLFNSYIFNVGEDFNFDDLFIQVDNLNDIQIKQFQESYENAKQAWIADVLKYIDSNSTDLILENRQQLLLTVIKQKRDGNDGLLKSIRASDDENLKKYFSEVRINTMVGLTNHPGEDFDDYSLFYLLDSLNDEEILSWRKKYYDTIAKNDNYATSPSTQNNLANAIGGLLAVSSIADSTKLINSTLLSNNFSREQQEFSSDYTNYTIGAIAVAGILYTQRAKLKAGWNYCKNTLSHTFYGNRPAAEQEIVANEAEVLRLNL